MQKPTRPVQPVQKKSPEEYFKILDELLKKKKGYGTLLAQDTGSNIPLNLTSNATPVRMPELSGGVVALQQADAALQNARTRQQSNIAPYTERQIAVDDGNRGPDDFQIIADPSPENIYQERLMNYQKNKPVPDNRGDVQGANDRNNRRAPIDMYYPEEPVAGASASMDRNQLIDYPGEIARGIQNANLTGQYGTGLSYMMQNQPEKARAQMAGTLSRIGTKLGAPELMTDELSQEQHTNPLAQLGGNLTDALGRGLNLPEMGLSEMLAGGRTTNSKAVNRPTKATQPRRTTTPTPARAQDIGDVLGIDDQKMIGPMGPTPTQQNKNYGPNAVNPLMGDPEGQYLTQSFHNYNPGVGYYNDQHSGIDLNYGPGNYGEIRSPIGGQVVDNYYNDAYGNTMIVKGLNPEEYDQLSDYEKANPESGENRDFVRLSHLNVRPPFKRGDKIGTGEAGLQMGTSGNSSGPHLDLEYGRGTLQDFLNFDKKKSFNEAFPEAGLDKLQNTWGTTGGAGGGNRGEAVKQNVANAFASLGKKLKLPELGISEGISNFGNSRVANLIDPKVYASEQPNKSSAPQQIQGGLDTLKRASSPTINETQISSKPSEKQYKAGQGVDSLKDYFPGVTNVATNVFKKIPLEKVSGSKKLGEASVGGEGVDKSIGGPLSSIAGLALNDNRDQFFKAGGADLYKDYLKTGVNSKYKGALDINLFKDTFFEDPNRVANTFANTYLAKPATEKYRAYIYNAFPVVPGHDKPTYRATARGRYDDGTEWSQDYDEVDQIYYQNQYNQGIRNSVPAQLTSDFKFTAPSGSSSQKPTKAAIAASGTYMAPSNMSPINSGMLSSKPNAPSSIIPSTSLAQAYTQTQSSPVLYSQSGAVIPKSSGYSTPTRTPVPTPTKASVSAPSRQSSAPQQSSQSRPSSAPAPAPTPSQAPKSVAPTYQAPKSTPAPQVNSSQPNRAPSSPVKQASKPAPAPAKSTNVFKQILSWLGF